MTQEGFEKYTKAIYSGNTGTYNSYLQAIRILDAIFLQKDMFALNGVSLVLLGDIDLLVRIADFVKSEEKKFKQGVPSIFDFGLPRQKSYPRGGFCSAAMWHLVRYYEYEYHKAADTIISKGGKHKGKDVSKKLIEHFDLGKEGKDVVSETKIRVGQAYFRRMILNNYNNKCCVTGLDIQPLLRASHIVAWSEDKANRLNPENGLCLSATYDAAFDQHLISFDEDCRMIISKQIKEHYTNQVVKDYFEKFEGQQIEMPLLYSPNKKLLQHHREMLL